MNDKSLGNSTLQVFEGGHAWGTMLENKGGWPLALSGIVGEGLVSNLVGVPVNYPSYPNSKL